MTIPGKVFTREEIISEIWKDAVVGDRTIDVHVRKIREKVGGHHIKTIKEKITHKSCQTIRVKR